VGTQCGVLPANTEMRLEDNYMSGIGASELNRAQAADGIERKAGKGASGGAVTGAPDEVALSTLTEQLQGLSAQLEAASDGSPARQARLSGLAAMVESGKYSPNVDELSGTLIATMQAEKP
jgi:Anti-sigma-28 factor, FlgM